MRKPRSDSKLKMLPAATREKIAAWCAAGSLAEARERCRKELGISTSEQRLSEFCKWQARADELRTGNELAMQALEWWKANRPDAGADELRAAQFFALSMKAQAGDDPELAIAVLREQGKDLDRGLAARRVLVLEAKLSAGREVMEDKKLSPQEREQKLREVFGL